ncbi:hypothetical protein QBC39DRAFT_158344 [Podospora conica]|nr:hypothetical protein QBC39DRAFT_158344 [Schizothecium conicum]
MDQSDLPKTEDPPKNDSGQTESLPPSDQTPRPPKRFTPGPATPVTSEQTESLPPGDQTPRPPKRFTPGPAAAAAAAVPLPETPRLPEQKEILSPSAQTPRPPKRSTPGPTSLGAAAAAVADAASVAIPETPRKVEQPRPASSGQKPGLLKRLAHGPTTAAADAASVALPETPRKADQPRPSSSGQTPRLPKRSTPAPTTPATSQGAGTAPETPDAPSAPTPSPMGTRDPPPRPATEGKASLPKWGAGLHPEDDPFISRSSGPRVSTGEFKLKRGPLLSDDEDSDEAAKPETPVKPGKASKHLEQFGVYDMYTPVKPAAASTSSAKQADYLLSPTPKPRSIPPNRPSSSGGRSTSRTGSSSARRATPAASPSHHQRTSAPTSPDKENIYDATPPRGDTAPRTPPKKEKKKSVYHSSPPGPATGPEKPRDGSDDAFPPPPGTPPSPGLDENGQPRAVSDDAFPPPPPPPPPPPRTPPSPEPDNSTWDERNLELQQLINNAAGGQVGKTPEQVDLDIKRRNQWAVDAVKANNPGGLPVFPNHNKGVDRLEKAKIRGELDRKRYQEFHAKHPEVNERLDRLAAAMFAEAEKQEEKKPVDEQERQGGLAFMGPYQWKEARNRGDLFPRVEEVENRPEEEEGEVENRPEEREGEGETKLESESMDTKTMADLAIAAVTSFIHSEEAQQAATAAAAAVKGLEERIEKMDATVLESLKASNLMIERLRGEVEGVQASLKEASLREGGHGPDYSDPDIVHRVVMALFVILFCLAGVLSLGWEACHRSNTLGRYAGVYVNGGFSGIRSYAIFDTPQSLLSYTLAAALGGAGLSWLYRHTFRV